MCRKSCHIKFIDMLKEIKMWKFKTLLHVKIYCINGWLSNLTALKNLWCDLQHFNIQYLFAGRLTQDSLENRFGIIRNKFGNCDHPSARIFRLALKIGITHDLLKPPTTANCQNDATHFLYNYQREPVL